MSKKLKFVMNDMSACGLKLSRGIIHSIMFNSFHFMTKLFRFYEFTNEYLINENENIISR